MKKTAMILILLAVWIGGCSYEDLDSDNMEKYPAGMVINGFTLPPEPDPKVNNATLLGVDTNHNGIRDDLERIVIVDESRDPSYQRLWTAIVLEKMKGYNDFMKEPTPQNKTRLLINTMDCYFYALKELRPKNIEGAEADQWGKAHGSRYFNYIVVKKHWDHVFNTPKRKEYEDLMRETSVLPHDDVPCTQEVLTLIDQAKGE